MGIANMPCQGYYRGILCHAAQVEVAVDFAEFIGGGRGSHPLRHPPLIAYRSVTLLILSGFPSDRYTQLVHRRSGRRAPTTPHPEAWLPLTPAGEGPHRSAISSRAKREIRK